MEYMKQLKDRHSIGELKRIEEAKKSQLVSDWLTKSVQKTKIHKIVEEQELEQREHVHKQKVLKDI